MNWVSFISGGITVILAYAMFVGDKEDETVVEIIEPGTGTTDLFVNGPSGRHVTMSCQTCRKLKRHQEIEPNLYQCNKCKRITDLRRVSLK